MAELNFGDWWLFSGVMCIIGYVLFFSSKTFWFSIFILLSILCLIGANLPDDTNKENNK